MCGIAGWIDYNGKERNEKTLKAMLETIEHRGPDAAEIYNDSYASLLHARLAVIDIEGGRQPMTREAKGEIYTIIYNGELYNTEELRRELLSVGYTFRGHSDTEVLLYAYIEWEEKCLDRLNGIYAFGVWKEREKSLFAARDRIGVKPFFFYEYSGGMIFASEIKTLMKSRMIKPLLDSEGLNQIFLLGPGRIPGSGVIKGIKELMPGEYMNFNRRSLTVKRYWHLEARQHNESLDETVLHTKELVMDAVNRQLVSDVPLSCFLSGGLDSSIISYLAAKKYQAEGKKLVTYSVDYEGNENYFTKNSFQPDADSKYIKIASQYIGSHHKNIVLDNIEVARAVYEAADARDIPGMADIDSSLLLFCREIKKQSTVCLSGECADEIFAGYPWYHSEEILNNPGFPWSNSINLRKSLFHREYLKNPEEFVDFQYRKTLALTHCLETDSAKDRRMREMFMLNFYWFMQTLLDRKDRMSMYNGLEVRVPFCDHNLVEYAYNMPWEYKALHGREKGILREAVKDMLPEEIVFRKKSPYPKTFNPDFLNFVRNQLINTIQSDGILAEIINKDFLADIIYGQELKEPWYGQLMRLPQIFAYLLQIDRFFENFGLDIDNT